jgi:biopolymer transport protein ExbD
MNPDEMSSKLKDLLANRVDKTVYIRSDSRARYETVVSVVDNLRDAGVDQVGLLTEQIQKKGAAAAATP